MVRAIFHKWGLERKTPETTSGGLISLLADTDRAAPLVTVKDAACTRIIRLKREVMRRFSRSTEAPLPRRTDKQGTEGKRLERFGVNCGNAPVILCIF